MVSKRLLLGSMFSFFIFSFVFQTHCETKPTSIETSNKQNIAPQKRLIALCLLYMFGPIGGHRFYVGKNITGILQLLTLGGLGVWTFVDMLYILLGRFTNADGKKLVDWT